MSWLLPTVIPAATGKVRNVGEPTSDELRRARNARWALTERGKEWRREYEAAHRAARNERTKKWRSSPKGQAWLAANRERRNAYYRLRYEFDDARKEYLRNKAREYRAAKKAKGVSE
jgi:hypothetical protein